MVSAQPNSCPWCGSAKPHHDVLDCRRRTVRYLRYIINTDSKTIAAIRAQLHSPEAQAKSRAFSSTRMKSLWQDEGWRKKMSASTSTSNKNRWRDPAERKKMLDGAKKGAKVRFGERSSLTGAEIRELRKKAGLTRGDLAEKTSVSPKTVSKWEVGKAAPPIAIEMLLRRLVDESLV